MAWKVELRTFLSHCSYLPTTTVLNCTVGCLLDCRICIILYWNF